ncbi:GNAT family N-acetyltransferase [Streptococcus sp. 20-1249]|uniref:GNAT family N-acetyltransferase n=1 Tax=Streptococcus hepaticus TaxID=3349163 RepID=UPI00374A4ECB
MEIHYADAGTTQAHIQRFFDQYDEQVLGHKLEIEKHSDQLVLQAIREEKVVAGLIAKKLFDSLHLSELAVKLNHRKEGIGTRLMNEMEDWARQKGVHVITISTESYQAQAFYEKFGYQEFGRLKDMPFKGVEKIYLVKYLESR